MSDDEGDEEIKQLELLEKKKRLYGTAMSDHEYKKRKKEIMKSFNSSASKAKGDGTTGRDEFDWVNWKGMTAVTATSFNQCQTKIKEDWSSDPKCRGGKLANFEGSNNCKFIRRIAKIKGELVNYTCTALSRSTTASTGSRPVS